MLEIEHQLLSLPMVPSVARTSTLHIPTLFDYDVAQELRSWRTHRLEVLRPNLLLCERENFVTSNSQWFPSFLTLS